MSLEPSWSEKQGVASWDHAMTGLENAASSAQNALQPADMAYEALYTHCPPYDSTEGSSWLDFFYPLLAMGFMAGLMSVVAFCCIG